MKVKFFLIWMIVIIACWSVPTMPVCAAEPVTVSPQTQIMVPDTTGMSVTEAEALLGSVELSEGVGIEIIKTYQYSDSALADVVLQQSISGNVSAQMAHSVNLVISLGPEPVEEQLLMSENVNEMSTFGLSAYRTQPAVIIDGNPEDWADKPCSWEYNWDNSFQCWFRGIWTEGEDGLKGYICPKDTYDANVRHKVSLFVDGEYVYLYIKFARCYDPGFNGWDYNFSLGEGQDTKYVLTDLDGSDFNARNKAPGVYELVVKHGDSDLSWQNVLGARAFLKIPEQAYNAELELCIPLSQMKAQNANADIEHIGMLQWWNPNLTYRRVSASGAGTMPFVMAGIALAGIPLSALLIRKKGIPKRGREAHE